MENVHIPLTALKGRGAVSRIAHRFESDARAAFDDGWGTLDEHHAEAPPPLRTEVSFETARKKFTKVDGDEPYAMRRKADEHFGRICRFFDTDKRRCTIYEARPWACRDYPSKDNCGYWDFLAFERNAQEDDDYVSTTSHNER